MSTKTTIRFWGVRGSIASPGPATAGVGGNTSCVEVRCGDTRLILDAGTGLRRLGESIMQEDDPTSPKASTDPPGEVRAEGAGGPRITKKTGGATRSTLLLSHLHWDHIQGLPFFLPAYVPGSELAIVGAQSAEMTLEEALAHQMRAPVFPVRLADLPAALELRHVRPGDRIDVGPAQVRVGRGNHPGGVLAYRIEHAGRAVVYATDTEHYACVDPALRDLSAGADVLIYDAQYTADEYAGVNGRSKVGWGHSTWEAAVALAREAGVRRLVLFHHDPQRDDAGVARIEALAQARFADTIAAREGLCLEIPGVASSKAA